MVVIVPSALSPGPSALSLVCGLAPDRPTRDVALERPHCLLERDLALAKARVADSRLCPYPQGNKDRSLSDNVDSGSVLGVIRSYNFGSPPHLSGTGKQYYWKGIWTYQVLY